MSEGATGQRAVIAGHAEFAEGMRSAVRAIIGETGQIVTVTNTGASAEEIERRLRAAIASIEARVIFTDLPAGSCTMAARRLQRSEAGLVVVVGANLATLLEFYSSEDPDGAALAQRAADRGRSALTALTPPPR